MYQWIYNTDNVTNTDNFDCFEMVCIELFNINKTDVIANVKIVTAFKTVVFFNSVYKFIISFF